MRAAALIILALALTLLAPTWVLLIGPIILGVPHIAGDLRYLIVRPRKEVGWTVLLAVLVPVALMAALRGYAMLKGGKPYLQFEAWLGCLAVAGAAVLAAGGSWLRRGVVAVGAAGLAAVLVRYPAHVWLLFGHLHNLVAFGIFCVWARERHERLPWAAMGAYAVCAALLLAGVPPIFADPALGITMTDQVATLQPFGVGAGWGSRIIMSYTFAQLVHYAVWIDLAPRALRGPSWRKELGGPLFWGTVAATVGLCAWGIVSPKGARDGYLSLVIWHGWLELAMLGHLWARRSGVGSVLEHEQPVATASQLRAA